MRLNQVQVRAVASSGGLPDPDLMAAIAMAESGGDTDAIGLLGEVGLWQINQPVHRKEHPQWTIAWLRNPANNAAAAKVILSSQGLKAWTAYTSGAYRSYLKAVPGTSQPAIGDVLGALLPDPLAPVTDAATGAVRVGSWLSERRNWLRIAYVGAGLLLVATGAGMLVRNDLTKDAATVARLLIGKGK